MSESTDLAVRDRGSQALQLAVLQGAELEAHWRIAKALADCGYYKDVRDTAQAFAKMIIGRELGLGPVQSMTSIYIIDGKHQVSSTTLAAFVKARDGYDYRVIEHDDKHCVIDFVRDDEVIGRSTFTIEDAERADLTGKTNWKKYPRNMLLARALSNGVRWFCPEVTNGMPVYTEGEVEPSASEVTGTAAAVSSAPTTSLRGVLLVDEVRAVIERARRVGHVGLSSIATAEMTLSGQNEERVRDWIALATTELDKLEPPDAEVVSDAEGVVDDESSSDDPDGIDESDDTAGEADIPPQAEGDEAASGVVEDAASEPAPEPEASIEEQRAALLRKAEEMDAHAENSEAEGDVEAAANYRGEAEAIRAAVEEDSEQGSLDI